MNIGLITARGGSRALPRKNVLPLKGKPLVSWTIEAALESKSLQRVYVSTEDEEIARISENCGAMIIDRPVELARDTTSSEAVVEHALRDLGRRSVDTETVCLLQPTSPLRTTMHIDAALEAFTQTKAECVVSVFQPRLTVAKAYRLQEDGSIKAILFDDAPYQRRQDLPTVLMPNGAIYVFGARRFLEYPRIPRTKVFPLVMSESESIDIDSLEDLAEAEKTFDGG